MLKKAITFTNIDGVTVTEEFHFQISQSDATKMMLVEGEDYQERIMKRTEERDGAKIIEHFENLLRAAVGKREGMRFVKNREITDYFMQSGAYDAFFMELIRTPDSGATIVAGM